jgi:hypothetical protein
MTSLRNALVARGHRVVHDLNETDIDIVLMIDPRFRSPHVGFGRCPRPSGPCALAIDLGAGARRVVR